jgi:hypothetical protein
MLQAPCDWACLWTVQKWASFSRIQLLNMAMVNYLKPNQRLPVCVFVFFARNFHIYNQKSSPLHEEIDTQKYYILQLEIWKMVWSILVFLKTSISLPASCSYVEILFLWQHVIIWFIIRCQFKQTGCCARHII